jgi:hypothetical protein
MSSRTLEEYERKKLTEVCVGGIVLSLLFLLFTVVLCGVHFLAFPSGNNSTITGDRGTNITVREH